MFKLLCRIVTIVVMLLLVGCGAHDEYEVEMQPQGDAYSRSLSVRRRTDKGQFTAYPADKRDRLAAMYDEQAADPGAYALRFVGRFTGQTPADVGGAGVYHRFASDMGDLFIYAERFRGDIDLDAQVQKMRQAADRMTDLLIGWFASALPDDPQRAELQRFLDVEFRSDLKTVALIAWRLRDRASDEDLIARVAFYLQERGYFEPKDVPTIANIGHDSSGHQTLAFFRRLIARRMGVPDEQPVPQSLALLADVQTLEASFNDYVRHSDEYQKLLAENENEDVADDGQPEPIEVLESIAGDLFRFKFELFGDGDDTVKVRLHSTDEPLFTNGEWDAEAQEVIWAGAAYEQSPEPLLCYAIWTEADETFQREHFGAVLVTDETLADYVMWRSALDQQQAKRWSSLVQDLRPGPTLREKLITSKDPRPAQPPAQQEDAANYQTIDYGRQLLLKALEQ